MTKHMWNKQAFDFFVSEAMLNDTEKFILQTRIDGMTITQQADKLNMSPDNVNKIIAIIKKKYDFIQADNSNILPPRRKSKKETYMDTH